MKRIYCIWLALTLVACGDDPINVVAPSFDRPENVAFACYNTVTQSVVPLAECQTDQTDSTLSLTAIVTQTSKGELGAVDVRTGQVLDSDIRVPGFTFIQVGEVPTAVVVPAQNPDTTYVSNFGSRNIQWLPTNTIRPDSGNMGGANGVLPLSDGPLDLVLGSQERNLYTILPVLGEILEIPILADGGLGTPNSTRLAITDPIPEPVLAQNEPTYERMCDGQSLSSPSSSVRSPSVGETPRPLDMLVDGDVLLVSDENQPLIHRFTIPGLVELPPIVTAVPVREMVVTPEVSDVFLGTDTRRYLYAIDATDGSVMAVDYTSDSPNFGAVLPVSVGLGNDDRIDLPSDALSLAVVVNRDDATLCSVGSDTTNIGPLRLRGVFLAVTLLDGTARIIDIEDLDASCRGGDTCDAPVIPGDFNVYVRRHRPRVGSLISNRSAVQGTPALRFGNDPGTVRNDGGAAAGGPVLSNVATCPERMGRIFPLDSQTPILMCGSSDPWSTFSQTWRGEWEGAIPNTRTGRARFDGTTIVTDDTRLCERGVLGKDDIESSALADSDPEKAYGGDQLIILSDIPPNASPDCARFALPEDDGVSEDRTRTIPLAFSIQTAQPSAITIGEPLGNYTLAEVAACFSGVFSYEIHSLNAYTLIGSRSGFRHRVIAGPAGCTVDLTKAVDPSDVATYKFDRILPDVAFINPELSFTISSVPGETTPEQLRALVSEFVFDIAAVPSPLVVDLGTRNGNNKLTLPENISYNPVDQSLYVVDSAGDALVRITVSPRVEILNVFE